MGDFQLGSERNYTSTLIITLVCSSKKKKYIKIILVQVYIIFALPDYSSEVIERLQNLFYEKLINLALEFDIH